jgi:Flp pilus assembly protein TadD
LLRSFGSVHARLGDKESAQRAYADATKLFKNSGAYEKISI